MMMVMVVVVVMVMLSMRKSHAGGGGERWDVLTSFICRRGNLVHLPRHTAHTVC
jgi:hypothetical protein